MRRLIFRFAAIALATLSIATSPLPTLAHGDDQAAHAGHDDESPTIAGDLELTAAWARAMLPNQPAGAGYLSITNNGQDGDRLVSISSPAADRVEIHMMEIVDDVMTMRPLEGGLDIPAGETVELAPGDLHIMFMEIAEPFREGGTVPVTLEFETAGTIELLLPVRAAHGGSGHDH